MMATIELDNAKPNLNHLQFEVLKLSHIYYQDSITLTRKGLDSKLVKILTRHTCIYVLNLSNNAFAGSIPSSLGALLHLESLDFSRNGLNGTIPTSLASLNFLAYYLNLSFNQLMGRIPSGNQFQTFSDNSFWGNVGLCGSPLSTNCSDGGLFETPNDYQYSTSETQTGIDWDLLSAEIGFVVGFVIVIGSLLFFNRWRNDYFEWVEDAAFWIFPLSVTRNWLSWTTTR